MFFLAGTLDAWISKFLHCNFSVHSVFHKLLKFHSVSCFPSSPNFSMSKTTRKKRSDLTRPVVRCEPLCPGQGEGVGSREFDRVTEEDLSKQPCSFFP